MPQKPQTLRRLGLTLAGALLIAGPLVLAIGHHASAAKPLEVLAPVVQTTRLTRGNLPLTTTISGTLAPYAQAKLYAKVAGYLKAVYVDKGDRVKAGQLLAVIDAPELKAQLSAAEAKTLQARANLVERQADYQKALSERRITALSADRLHAARKQTPALIAPMEEDLARAKAEQAAAQVATARGQIAAAQAEVESQKAAERQFAEQLAYTRITAPFNGIVSQRFLDAGAMVQTGVSSASQAVPVLEVIDPDRLRLDVNVSEMDVPYVKKGTPVTISLPAMPGVSRETTITRTSLAEATDTRTMLAEAELPNADHSWHPGMYAKVTLRLQVHTQVLTLSDEAIHREGEHTSAFVVDADNKLKLVPIELGADDGVRAEILAGLTSDETVALPGNDPLKDGMAVRHA